MIHISSFNLRTESNVEGGKKKKQVYLNFNSQEDCYPRPTKYQHIYCFATFQVTVTRTKFIRVSRPSPYLPKKFFSSIVIQCRDKQPFPIVLQQVLRSKLREIQNLKASFLCFSDEKRTCLQKIQ